MQGSPLYRARARVGYKFFNSSYMVVFSEDQISNITINLAWEPNFTPNNSEVQNADLMSYSTNNNTCNVTLIDPFFTGIAFPSLIDTAYQVLGNDRGGYSSMGVLLPPCESGQVPGKDRCWNYEKFDPSALAQNPSDEALRDLIASDVNIYTPAMLFVSLWYETPQGYTFGTDYIFRVASASVVHGSEYPTVTIGGIGNYGVVFQNKLNNMSAEKDVPIEQTLEEIANRNGFKLNFCTADYSKPQSLNRKVIKSNVTTRDFLNDIVRGEYGGDMLSPPTKEFFDTLHVCTRADTYQGCNIFYLGKPLYEGYQLSANVDPSWVARNYSFGDAQAIPGQNTNVSQYSPEINFLTESSWELVKPPADEKNASLNNPEYVKISGDNYEIKYRDGDKVWKGTWKGFLDERDKYFTQINQKFIYFELSGKNVVKKEKEKANPGVLGRWSDNTAMSIFAGDISNLEKVPNSSSLKAFTLKTNRKIIVKNSEKQSVPLDVFIHFSNVNTNPDIVQGGKVKMGQLIGTGDEKNYQTLTFYTVVAGGEKVYLEPELALKYTYAANEVPPPAPGETARTGSAAPQGNSTIGGDLTAIEKAVAEYFNRQGFTKAAIATILGTVKKESSFRGDAKNGKYYGIIQWEPPRRKNFPANPGDNTQYVLAQCAYLLKEVSNGQNAEVYNLLKTSNDLEKVMGKFTDLYVRPSAENRKRTSPRFVYAREYFKKIKFNPAVTGTPGKTTYESPQVGHDQAQNSTTGCANNATTCYGHYKYNEYSGRAVAVGTDSDNGTVTLHPDAAAKFKEMQAAASAAGLTLKPISGFRNKQTQAGIWGRKTESFSVRAQVVAPPGYSEHHTGYTIDVWDGNGNRLIKNFEKTGLYTWMKSNASKYGFELSFPSGNSQGVSFEPWHWRYVGTPEAKKVFTDAQAAASGGSATSTTSIQPSAVGDKCGSFSGFVWPMEGVVKSPYGTRYGGAKGHGGIDIGDGSVGKPIYAAASGTVKLTSDGCPTYGSYVRCRDNPGNANCKCSKQGFKGFGNGVIIDHGNGYVTYYAHMAQGSIKVKEGDKVCQCQEIGGMGSSGSSTGLHLHFEIRKNGSKLDPHPGSRPPQNKPIKKCDNKDIYKASSTGASPITAAQPGGQSSTGAGQEGGKGQSQPGRSGFTIETSFKGIPRALRILPKFTVLSLVTKYSEWFAKGFVDDDSLDPGIWIPDYFRNWLTTGVNYNWTSGDLRCTINAMSSFGMDNSDSVPDWETYVNKDIQSKGALSSYKDYIRGFGDLCWTLEDGTPSCHTKCNLTEDFIDFMRENPDGTVSALGSTSAPGCNINNGKISLSEEDRSALRKIVLAEAKGEKTVGMALVARAIFNRKLLIDSGVNVYCSNGNSIKAIVEAKCPNSSRYQFSPLDSDIATYNKQSPADYPLADEAIALAFDTDALKAANISDYILTACNFRNAATSGAARGGNWIDNGQIYLRHTFARDDKQHPKYKIPEHLAAFEAKYGKCERLEQQTATTTATNKTPQSCLTFVDVSPLATFIKRFESTSAGYNAVNVPSGGATRGSNFDKETGKSYKNITVGEIINLQNNKKLYAVGKYQIIPSTLSKAMSSQGIGIKTSDAFNETTQDNLFLWLVTTKRPGIGKYLAGETNDVIEAAQEVAREWAGIGISKPESPLKQLQESGTDTSKRTIQLDLSKNRKIGQSLYWGFGGNNTTPNNQNQTQEVLKQIKSKIGDKCKGTTTSTASLVRKYKTTANSTTALWNTNGRKDTMKKLAIAAGHWYDQAISNYPKHGGARIHEGMSQAPDGPVNYNGRTMIDERQHNKKILAALASAARARGIEVAVLDTNTSSSMTLDGVLGWLERKRAEGYYSFEIHNDINAPGGRSGVIPGTDIWEMDKKLANEFGYFPKNWRQIRVTTKKTAILEINSMYEVNAKGPKEWDAMINEAVDRILDSLYGK